ncbi:hypothetical protein WN51_05553 [Melipona quadrifasciata]|uniref:Uncharacterized protein n=1 Tax=Melipona quadrifasciata TaxID=166423 RepID=A0A0M8ZR24_9HYME|nr:hypothetical protein WN51_05553 [Melipona quadrifasciata]
MPHDARKRFKSTNYNHKHQHPRRTQNCKPNPIADALDLNRFFWHGNQPQTTEEVQIVEIVRWRQPVCVKPARGVSLCLEELQEFQTEYERVTGKRLKEEKERYSVLTDVQSKSSAPSLDQEVLSKFESPEIVVPFPGKQSQPSEESLEEKSVESSRRTSVLTEGQERNIRKEKQLPHLEKVTKPRQIYVTKVLNAPVTATLVAHNCLPDVGIPLCEHDEGDVEASESHDVRPTLSITLANTNNEDIVELSGDTFHRFLTKSIGEVDEKKPEIVTKNPNLVQTSTSFALNYPGATRTPVLQLAISKNGGPVVPNVAREPTVLDNISPCSVLENRSPKESSNQFAEFETKKSSIEGETEDEASRKQEISLDNVHDVDKFDLGDGKPVRVPVFSDWLKVMDNTEETSHVPKP